MLSKQQLSYSACAVICHWFNKLLFVIWENKIADFPRVFCILKVKSSFDDGHLYGYFRWKLGIHNILNRENMIHTYLNSYVIHETLLLDTEMHNDARTAGLGFFCIRHIYSMVSTVCWFNLLLVNQLIDTFLLGCKYTSILNKTL